MSSVTRESGGGKFTDGSWRDRRGSGDFQREVIADNGRVIICETISNGNAIANARLIAAAPDMYAALEAAYELATCDRHDGDDVAARIRHVLSKAKGGAA